MNELVFAKGTQLTAEDNAAKTSGSDKSQKKKKTSPIDVLALVTGGIAAFEALASTDLASIADKTKDLVKNPYAAVIIMAAYVFMVMSNDD